MQDNVDEEIEWASMFWPCNQRFIVKYWMSLKIADKRCWLVMIHWTRYTWQKKCMVVDIHRFAKRSIRRSTGRRKKTKTNKEAKERRKRKRNDYQFLKTAFLTPIIWTWNHESNFLSSFLLPSSFINLNGLEEAEEAKAEKVNLELTSTASSFIFILCIHFSILWPWCLFLYLFCVLCLQLLHLTTFHWLKFHKNAITQQDTMTKEVSKNSRVIR